MIDDNYDDDGFVSDFDKGKNLQVFSVFDHLSF